MFVSKLELIAKLANYMAISGKVSLADKLYVVLEKHNCCLVCGTKQIFDEAYYRRFGIWKCPKCDGF